MQTIPNLKSQMIWVCWQTTS